MSLAEDVLQTASDAVDHFEPRAEGPLDYSVSSLAVVEQVLDEASDFVDEMPDDAVAGIVQGLGCYVLEVGRRAYGGEYRWSAEREQPVLVVGEPDCHVAMMTWDKVRGRLGGDEADSIPFHFEGFAARAQKAEPGDHVLFV